MSDKYSSDNKMKKLFEGFRGFSEDERIDEQSNLFDGNTAVDKEGESSKPNPASNTSIGGATAVDKEGESPNTSVGGSTAVDQKGDSGVVQKKAQAFDQVEAALKQLLKKIQDAGL